MTKISKMQARLNSKKFKKTEAVKSTGLKFFEVDPQPVEFNPKPVEVVFTFYDAAPFVEVTYKEPSFTQFEMQTLFETWYKTECTQWNKSQMLNFILFQNAAVPETGRPAVKHSANALADFAGIDGDKLIEFNEVYEQLYPVFKPEDLESIVQDYLTEMNFN